MSRSLTALATAVGLALVVHTTAADGALGPTPPTPTTSWYVYVTSDETDPTLNSWAKSAGMLYAKLRLLQGFVVLDFGQPWKSGADYGTWSFNPTYGRFLSTATIREAVKHYIRGFIMGSAAEPRTTYLWLGVGTNNYGSHVTDAHGRAWARMMVEIQAWLAQSGLGSRVFLRSANDIELGYSAPDKIASWLAGYRAVPNTNSVYNYGDAQGCPQGQSSNVSRPCGGKPGWTQDKVVRNTLQLLPQIYSTGGGNAKQWQQLVLYYFLRYNHKPAIFGALAQRQACQQRGGCEGANNTPAQAWSQLTIRLSSDSRTAGAPHFSTDMKWRK